MTTSGWCARSWTAATCLALGLAASGCSGTLQPTVDGGTGDRPRNVVNDARVANDVRGGLDFSFDIVRPDLPPPPMPGPDSKLLVPGRATILGTHQSACSNQVPASDNGDRWCAFSLPGRSLGKTDLWVINATKALAPGANVKCDGTDPACKRLSDDLWTGVSDVGPSYPTGHRFDGDTLIFYANAGAGLDLYAGRVYAWRPGWADPRQASSGAKAFTCSGHFRAEVVVCIENLSQEMQQPLEFDLTAGNLMDGTKKIARIIPSRPGSNASQWRAGFNRKGDVFMFSTGGRTTGSVDRETLSYVRTPDIGTADKIVEVIKGASRWQIALDGQKVYYLKGYNYSTMGDPSGTLVMADFPSGENETTLASAVGAYQLLFDGTETDRGLGIFDNVAAGTGTFKVIRDRNKKDEVATVVRNVGGALVSRDLRYVLYSKDFDENLGTSDLHVVKIDGTGTCALASTLTADLFGAAFPPSAGLALWADKIDPLDGVGEGWIGNPAGCTNRRMWSRAIDFWFFSGDEGLVYSDEGVGSTATLKFLRITGGSTLGTPTEIQKQVGRVFALLPDFSGVLFTIGRMVTFDGLYGYSKLPFSGTTSPRDGGVDSTAPRDALPGDTGSSPTDASGDI